jgi:DNA gyrase subunit A
VFRKRVFELPVGTRGSRPKALVNFLELKEGEQILEMVPYREDEVDDDHFVVLASAQGYIKRTSLEEFANIRASGLIAATVLEGDRLIDARLTDGHCHIVLASAAGQSIRFAESDVRPMGRTARGVKGMALREGDAVVDMLVIPEASQADLLTLCENGYGKRTAAEEYRPQSRAGLGIKTIKVTERNGPVAGMLLVHAEDQLMVVTDRGRVIRTRVADISVLGRDTQGVRVIRVDEGEKVVAITRVEASDAEQEGEDIERPEALEDGDGGEAEDEGGEDAGEGDGEPEAGGDEEAPE